MADKKKADKKKPQRKATPGSAASQKRPNLNLGERFASQGSLPTMRPC